MKVRTGFVSNSSSSSFLVPYKLVNGNDEQILLTEEEVSKLLGYGFKWIHTDNPFELYYHGLDGSITSYKSKRMALAFDVPVNQDNVAYFLTRVLNVSYKATIHYANWYSYYKKGTKYIHYVINKGITEEMYGPSDTYERKQKYKYPIEDLTDPRDYEEELEERLKEVKVHGLQIKEED